MAVTLNKANLVLKDANGNIGKIEQLSSNDLAKIKTAVSDVALVVNQSNHTPIEATTTNKGVVQLATSADVVSGASDKVVTAEQLHNSTTGTSALATENLARIDAVVTEAGISVDHTNTNQLKTAVTTLISNATPATATANTLGVVKPDNDTITIDSNGVLTATAQMPGVATTTNVGVVKPDNDTITIDSNGVLTATAQMPGVATASSVGVVKPDNDTITVGADGTLTATAQMPGVATTTNVGVVKPDGTTITVDGDGTLTCGGKDLVRSVNGVGADENGNVKLGTEKSTFNKVVFDTGYFSIGMNATYNFDLTGTDLENVSKENVNIRLVAKVTTAHNGFEVGDIAQLTTGIDITYHSILDVCTYVRGNTLYVYSGENSSFSIFNGANWLSKANVQIKAVLTAFIPDDGSILLIAEDQTNTSKLIGLPDGTLTWGDKNISLLSPVHYSRSSNFETSGRTSIKLPSYLSLMVNGHHFRNDVEVTVDISDTANWDSTETDYTVAENRAGKDFYIYAIDDKVTKSVHIVLSANSTVPTGYTESSSRKIGGFHCLCADVGTPTWRNPATLKDEAHWLSGYLAGDILPASIWDLSHRATSENEGMVYSSETGMWFDIYLSSWDGEKLVSVLGGTTADGTSSKPFHGEMFAECAAQVKKELISHDNFIVVAKGSNERTAIHGAADAGTTGGHVDTANRRMISNIGLEDCCGFLWQWCKQSNGGNGSKGWTNSNYHSAVDGSETYGTAYGHFNRASVGAYWDDAAHCGSRSVDVERYSSLVDARFGGRLASPERVSTGL